MKPTDFKTLPHSRRAWAIFYDVCRQNRWPEDRMKKYIKALRLQDVDKTNSYKSPRELMEEIDREIICERPDPGEEPNWEEPQIT